MKKERLDKIKAIIQQDVLSAGDKFMELLHLDINKLLSDYFCFNTNPTIEIVKEGNRFKVCINIVAKEIKNFGFIVNT